MMLNNNQVDLWLINTILTPTQLALLQAYLDAQEMVRAKRFRSPEQQQRFIIAHGFLRFILSKYLQQAPDTINFTYNKHNKPALAVNPQHYQFNLSHSQQQIAIAVTKQAAIGIDIEVSKEREIADLITRY